MHLHLCLDYQEQLTGKVQLIDASSFWQKMRKNLGNKRKELSDDQVSVIALSPSGDRYGMSGVGWLWGPKTSRRGNPAGLQRDTKNVLLAESEDSHFKREVLPPREPSVIDAEQKQCTNRIMAMTQELSA